MICEKLRKTLGSAWLEMLLAISIVALILHTLGPQAWSAWIAPILEEHQRYALRNPDFPETYISRIHLDLTSPHHYVTLTWTGPEAEPQKTGPFRSCPGAGLGFNDCNDPVESNCAGSQCTPKGLRKVEGFSDSFQSFPECKFLTVIDGKRAISFHSHPKVLDYPASQGCIRLDEYPAQLIHNNSLVGVTEVLIDGEWSHPAELAAAKTNLEK